MVDQIFTIVFSMSAVDKVNQIHDFYAEKISAEYADRIRSGIIAAADSLTKLPASKPILLDTDHMPFKVRYTKSKSYKIIFRIEFATNTVRVLNINHDAEDPERVIDEI